MAETAICRYIRLRSLNAYDSNNGTYTADFTTCAEIDLLDSTLTPLSRAGWTASADSQEVNSESAPASNVLDGNNTTHWHTRYNPTVDPQPHLITLDMGAQVAFSKFRWRNRASGTNGCVGSYQIECSNNGTDWTQVAAATMQTGTPTAGATFSIDISFAPPAIPELSWAGRKMRKPGRGPLSKGRLFVVPPWATTDDVVAPTIVWRTERGNGRIIASRWLGGGF